MKMEPTIGLSLLIPNLLCSLLLAAGALVLLGNVPAAWIAVTAGLACTVAGTFNLMRSSRVACARLRRPELRHSDVRGTGPYADVVLEAQSLVSNWEQQLRDAVEAKSELEARAHVRQSQLRQFQITLNHLDQPILMTDAHDRVQFCNEHARKLFQHMGLQDRAVSDSIQPPPDLQQCSELYALLQETRLRNAATNIRKAEFELTVDGEPIHYRATCVHLAEEGGSTLGTVTILENIQGERQEKTRHAEFVSSVCHELKTPMASIKAFIEMLMDGDITEVEEQHELYGFIDVQVDRLTRLVNNMLNLARIESGVIKIQREDCELNDLLHKALNVIQPTADEKQIRIVSELSELYMPAHVDTDVFGQAIINLLSNAVKYTPEGGEVRLRSRMDDSRAVIEVRDTGMGIPEESLPHIFDRFYRVPENNQAAAGTGLGLSLVQYIVTELHNGTISVDSEVGRGTTFQLTIPLGHRERSKNARNKTPACIV